MQRTQGFRDKGNANPEMCLAAYITDVYKNINVYLPLITFIYLF